MASFAQRMVGAAMLSPATYEAVEHDRNATPQAALVVVLAAVAAAVGVRAHGDEAVVREVLRSLLQWLAWSGVTYFVGTRVFRGTATFGELLRTIGFAQAPGIFLALGGIPYLGWWVRTIVGLWTLVAVVIAIRQALDVDTGRAVLTMLVGLIVVTAIVVALGVVTAAIAGLLALLVFW
jgi:hypothetical protein